MSEASAATPCSCSVSISPLSRASASSSVSGGGSRPQPVSIEARRTGNRRRMVNLLVGAGLGLEAAQVLLGNMNGVQNRIRDERQKLLLRGVRPVLQHLHDE